MNFSLQNQIAHLAQLLNQKHYSKVIQSVDGLLDANQSNDILHHLKALALKNLGEHRAAIESFKLCLAIKRDQVEVLNNLGNTYKIDEQFEQAVDCYQQALTLKPNFTEAKRNLALVYQQQAKFTQALRLFQQISSANPNDVSALTSIANIAKEQGDHNNAILLYKSVLQIQPNYVNALHNLGLTYKLIEDHQSALACFKQAQQFAPKIAEIDFSLANTYFEINQYSLAEQSYWSAINKKPLYIEAHSTLNEFYWQVGKQNEFGKSYDLVLQQIKNAPELSASYIEQLFSAGADEKAQAILAKTPNVALNDKLMAIQAKVLIIQQDFSGAIDAFKHSLALRFEVNVALDYIELLIKQAEYNQALEIIQQVELVQPYHQLNIAFKSLCWRLLGDERYHWLVDYSRFIQPYELPTPKGYQNLAEFLTRLESTLLGMHDKVHEPLKQTLKNGTQTPGRLLHKPVSVIQELKGSLEQVVSQFVASLPDDNTHPLLKRKSSQTKFSGSWSVKLKPNGFHVNHVHPDGWLSSAFYIKLPDFQSYPQESKYAGAIKFGESGIQLGEREVVERIIQPEAGQLVLFPSYVWHGTYAFNGDRDDFRVTSPFDVVPVGE